MLTLSAGRAGFTALILVYLLIAMTLASGGGSMLLLCLPLVAIGFGLSIRPIDRPDIVLGAVLLTLAVVVVLIRPELSFGMVVGLMIQLGILTLLTLFVAEYLNEQEPLLSNSSDGKLDEIIVPAAHADEAIALEMRRARRYNRPLSLVLMRFPEVNRGGLNDEEIYQELKDKKRQFDVVCRLSRRELLVLCVNTEKYEAQKTAVRLGNLLGPKSTAIATFPTDGIAPVDLLEQVRAEVQGVKGSVEDAEARSAGQAI